MSIFFRSARAIWAVVLLLSAHALAESVSPVRYPSDEDILSTWGQWRDATAGQNHKRADAALADLVNLRRDLGIGNLDEVAAGLVRAADSRLQASDSTSAWVLASTAVALAPEAPYPRWAALRAAWSADPWDVGRWFPAGAAAIERGWTHPRFGRAHLANAGAGVLLGILVAASLIVAIFFLRHVRYFSHDLWHVFPRLTFKPLAMVVGLTLVCIPIVFRLGLAAALIGLFISVAFYLTFVERAAVACLIAVVGLLPPAGTWIAEHSVFPGTVAEALYEIENGGLSASRYVAELARKVDEQRSTFVEAFALGRYEYRRGKLDSALEHLKKAADMRTGDARLLTNLGNALFSKGDLDGAAELYNAASQADPTLAAPLYNLSQVHYRKGAQQPDERKALEVGKAQDALAAAQKLDPNLPSKSDAAEDKATPNRLLVSPGLTSDEIFSVYDTSTAGRRISAQLASWILGTSDGGFWYLYPLGFAALIFTVTWLRSFGRHSRGCERCGDLVCSKCNPGLPRTSLSCASCLISLGRSDALSESRAEKDADILKYKRRRKALTYITGVLFAGTGHVLLGAPLAGIAYAIAAAILLFNLVLTRGILRVPYADPSGGVSIPTCAALLGILYAASLFGLRNRQQE